MKVRYGSEKSIEHRIKNYHILPSFTITHLFNYYMLKDMTTVENNGSWELALSGYIRGRFVPISIN